MWNCHVNMQNVALGNVTNRYLLMMAFYIRNDNNPIKLIIS